MEERSISNHVVETYPDMTTQTLAPPKTKSQALRSFDVGDFPALNGREEEWRFTPLKRLRGLATADGSAAVAGPPKHEYGQLPAGVTVSTLERSDSRVGSVLTPFDRVSALAAGHTDRVLLISVSREAVVKEPAVVKRWEEIGAESSTMTPAEFTRFIQAEIDKWVPVVKASGAKPE